MSSYRLPSGDEFPLIGLGTWQGEGEEIKDAVKEALKAGYRHIDSAWAYLNEEQVGQAIRESIESGVLTRQELFYTTKLPQIGHRKEKVKHFLQLSLKKLGLDYVDLYLIHFPVATQYSEEFPVWALDSEGKVLLDEEVDLLETWKAMEECVDVGLARNVGLSNYNAQQIQYIYDNARIKPAALQVECHIYLQQRPLLDLCKKLGIALTAYSPLGSPGLAGFIKKRQGLDIVLPVSVLEEPLIKSLAEKYAKSPAQVALRFLVQRGIVVIPKSVTPRRIKENFEILDFTLEEIDMDAIAKLDKGIRLIKFDFLPGITESKKFPFNAPF